MSFGTNKKLTKTNPFLLNIDLESSKKDVCTYIGFGWIALAGGGVPTKKRERPLRRTFCFMQICAYGGERAK